MAKQPVPRKNKRPSMQNVAELAGVSRTTVSFVVNETPHADNIPQETQERIWAAVKELGYRPNVLAQGLRSSRTKTIGFISDKIGTTPYAGKILQGAQELAWEHNILLLYVNTGGNEALKQAAVDTLLDRQVDGIIYATMYHRKVDPPESLQEIPSVLLDCFVEDRSLPSVVPDEIQGGRTATEFLLKKGHRRIGFAKDIRPVPAAIGRLKGFKQALAADDVPFEEELVQMGDSWTAGGYQATTALMDLPNPPSAIFCYNDRMAMGAYHVLRERNLSIPNDVAIVGFDDQELIASELRPPLTTVALPHYEMGQWAVEHLLDLVEQQLKGEPPGQPVQQMLECPLIERESV